MCTCWGGDDFGTVASGEKPPVDKALNRWMNQFKETGTVEKQKSTGRPRTSEKDVKRIRQSCIRSHKNQLHVEV